MTHASHAAIKRAWNTLTQAVRPPDRFAEPRFETILAPSASGQVCECDVVWLRLRGHWHFAFLNIPGVTYEDCLPTHNIEALASWALRVTRARLSRLTVWDVEKYAPGKITLHRVEFTPRFGRTATKSVSYPDTPPVEVWTGIALALRLQSQRRAVANAIQ